MLITLMFSTVTRKSKTFFSFSCSANEQVCRSWEGARPGSQPEVATGNTPCHRQHAQFTDGGWPGGEGYGLFSFLGV